MTKGNILVAPLNWGLGHATRCIPIILELQKDGFMPILASDGAALSLLQKEFPNLPTEELPSYLIKYPEEGKSFRRQLLLSLPKIKRAVSEENEITSALVQKYDLKGIISDNRLGVRDPKVPSVIITHQLNVLSGKTTLISSYIHQHYIKKFTECWVPDVKGKKSLSGKLGFTRKNPKNIKYIGVLSRLDFFKSEKRYDLLVLLSGPEPQRGILEKKLLKELKYSDKDILFVKGLMEPAQTFERFGNIKVYNFLVGHQLENAINSSSCVLSRSGYSTIMDLAKMQQKAFFIPTPGQFEQEYLAKRCRKLKIAPYCKQHKFSVKKLKNIEKFSGFTGYVFPDSFRSHFSLFHSE